LRVEFEGAMYHVIQRGNNREFIFAQPESREYLIKLMKNTVDADGVEIFAYVVMSNHYHIALRTGDVSISKVMHKLNSGFSRYYNRSQGRTGHVFEGRYKSIPIENEHYLLAVTRYIHRNPVRAEICASAADYEWSSDNEYRSRKEGFVHIKLVLEMMGNEPQAARKEYALFMEEDDNVNWEGNTCIGRDSFALLVEPRKAVPRRKRLDEILLATGVNIDDFTQIKAGTRKRTLASFKAAYAREALNQGYTMHEIGSHISISAPAVCKLLR